MFVVVGLIFIPVGVLIIVASNGVIEYEVPYTKCRAHKYWYDESEIREPLTETACSDIYDEWRTNLTENPSEMEPPTCICKENLQITETMEKTVRYIKNKTGLLIILVRETAYVRMDIFVGFVG